MGATEFAKCGVIGNEIAAFVDNFFICGKGSSCKGDTCKWGYSGGGISNSYAQAAYGKVAVANWFKKAQANGTLPPSKYWNNGKGATAALGNGSPDVSALGVTEYVLNGKWVGGGGTSSSSPFFGGMVALMNGARLEKGMSPMGFINPWLYKVHAENPDAFDITEGNNYYRKGNVGFVASEGWDPVTGLGSPNMRVLMDLATKSPEVGDSP